MEMLGEAGKRGAVEAQETEVLAGLVERAPGSGEDRRCKLLQLRQERAGVQDEDAAIPEVATIGEVGFGRGTVGLFEEGIDREATGLASQRGAAADVAIAGVRPGRRDAEENELARCRDGGRPLQGADERLGVLHHVVGRHHGNDRVGGFAQRGQRGDSHRGGGVPRDRLEDDCLGLQGCTRQLLAHQEAVVVVADNDRRGERGVVDTAQGGAEQRALPIEEADELLGIHRPRQRPQTRAGAAGQDHGNDHEPIATNICTDQS